MRSYDVNVTAVRIAGILTKEFTTQKEASQCLGVQAATLKNYLSGKSRIPPDVLFNISRWTGVSSDYLLGLVDQDDMSNNN